MATTPGAAWADDTAIGSIERMVQLDSHGNVTIEIGTQRLPARMVARRIGADLRVSRNHVSRRPNVRRVAAAMLVMLLVPLVSVARYRHATATQVPAA